MARSASADRTALRADTTHGSAVKRTAPHHFCIGLATKADKPRARGFSARAATLGYAGGVVSSSTPRSLRPLGALRCKESIHVLARKVPSSRGWRSRLRGGRWPVSGYKLRTLEVSTGGQRFSLRVLRDKDQYCDADGAAARAGISSAQWGLFGNLWPVARLLTNVMIDFDVQGKRILEVGCGLALPSLMLQRRDAEITASDNHPLAERFLQRNALRNGLRPVPYVNAPWDTMQPSLGRFDLIIGSDLLYERGSAERVADFVDRHACTAAEFVLTDAGRGHSNALSRVLQAQDYRLTEQHLQFEGGEATPSRGRLLIYRR